MDKTSKKFRIGDSVEVESKEEGFRGSYFAAKVLDVTKNYVLVEYKTLVTDDESRRLRERVHVSEVRPRPPQIQVSNFNSLDKVDAYDNEGWWVGRISSISKSKYHACFNGNNTKGSADDEVPQKRRLIDESKYCVYFSSTGDEIAYPFSRLRLHQEWKNGHWLVPSSSCLF